MVEVAYALPQQQLIIPLKVKPGTTAQEAVQLSGILQKFPDIALENTQMGIFGKVVKADTALRAMDRVEIYRPLLADPKEVRRQRAADGKIMKKGGGDLPEE
ncbi:MAG TPA: RnfH family protein [Methylophilus sp.]